MITDSAQQAVGTGAAVDQAGSLGLSAGADMCPPLLDGAGKDGAIVEVHAGLACSVAFQRLAVVLRFQLLTALQSGLICIKRREMCASKLGE